MQLRNIGSELHQPTIQMFSKVAQDA